MQWSPSFLTLRPSAAKVFAIAWQMKISIMLQERGLDTKQASSVREEAFEAAIADSSSLPVRDQVSRITALHCARLLMAYHHPYGQGINTTVVSFHWSNNDYVRYLSVLRRHGLSIEHR
jgi:hypothetical protein